MKTKSELYLLVVWAFIMGISYEVNRESDRVKHYKTKIELCSLWNTSDSGTLGGLEKRLASLTPRRIEKYHVEGLEGGRNTFIKSNPTNPYYEGEQTIGESYTSLRKTAEEMLRAKEELEDLLRRWEGLIEKSLAPNDGPPPDRELMSLHIAVLRTEWHMNSVNVISDLPYMTYLGALLRAERKGLQRYLKKNSMDLPRTQQISEWITDHIEARRQLQENAETMESVIEKLNEDIEALGEEYDRARTKCREF